MPVEAPVMRAVPCEGELLMIFSFGGVERDSQCHGTRVRLHRTGANRERVPSVLGGIRDPSVLAHATVSARDRAISTHPVPSYASPDSARVARRLRSHDPGGRPQNVYRVHG